MTRKPRLYLILTEDPFYMPRPLEKFLDAFQDQIVGAVFPPGFLGVKRIFSTLLIYGPVGFARIVAVFLYHIASGGRLKNMLRRRGIPFVADRSLNSSQFINSLNSLDVDILVSITCPERVRKAALSIPRLAAINLHPSKLPAFRGVLPVLNAIADGEKEIGVTIHHMTESLDSGDIINQRTLAVRRGDDLASLLPRVYDVGMDLLIEAITEIGNNSAKRFPNGPDGASYFSYPSIGRIMRYHRAVAENRRH